MKNDDNKIKDVKSTVNLISGALFLHNCIGGYRQNQRGVPYDKRIVWNCRYGISAVDHTVGKIGRTAGIFRVGIYF